MAFYTFDYFGKCSYKSGTWLEPRDGGLLKFMHWNVNSLSAHDFIRIPLIQSLNSLNDYDIIAITETALNIDTPDDRLALNGFLPMRRDIPHGTMVTS